MINRLKVRCRIIRGSPHEGKLRDNITGTGRDFDVCHSGSERRCILVELLEAGDESEQATTVSPLIGQPQHGCESRCWGT